MKRLILAVLGILSLSTTGCTSQFGKPTDITLEKALTSVGVGLAGLRTAERSVPGAGGLVPQTVTITFNVGASASDSGNLAIQASVPAGPATVGINGGENSSQSANRSNQITVTLTNILFTPSNTGLLGGDATKLDSLLTALKNHGYDLYVMDTSTLSADMKAQVEAIHKLTVTRINHALQEPEKKK